MVRPSNTRERRQQIVAAMCELMAESGYDGATTQAIAEKSGLSQGLIHYHFKSKLEIVLALMDRLQDSLWSRFKTLEEHRAPSNDPFGELSSFVDAHLALGEDADRSAVSCWIVIGAEALRQREIRERYQKFCADQIILLEQLIDTCLFKLGLERTSKRRLALAVMAAIEGSYRLVIAAPQLLDAGFAAPTVMAMLKAAICAEKEDAS